MVAGLTNGELIAPMTYEENMGSYQKAPQKGITKLQYLLRGSFVLFLFQLTILSA
ncbi:hypothetical protein A66_00335 [Streptococcus pneumoniae]|nr:hypothetical protein A66_00335 [Streptococcus pneumoniae]